MTSDERVMNVREYETYEICLILEARVAYISSVCLGATFSSTFSTT